MPPADLDRESEGLVILTDDGKLQQQITRPGKKSWKNLLGAGGRNSQRSEYRATEAGSGVERWPHPAGKGQKDCRTNPMAEESPGAVSRQDTNPMGLKSHCRREETVRYVV